jgi:2-polyprenyl-3-methyl-5-hydroxy-6-metoxy-1,4-benzoquinol methylase
MENRIMNTEKRDFDKEAWAWDEKSYRVRLANDIADAIKKEVELKPDMDVMDFGCGTGLLTLHLQPLVRSITGVDSSQGMIDMLAKKAETVKLSNMKTALVDLDRGDKIPGGPYHLIVSSMTLHHVKDVEHLFEQLYGVLIPSGYLCFADLDSEDGQFHRDNTGVFHYGFDRTELKRTLTKIGFGDVHFTSATEMTRETAGGEMRTFTVFLVTARKTPGKQ